MTAAIVFDLDNTLFDPTTIPLDLIAPAEQAAREANVGAEAVPVKHLEAALVQSRREAFSLVAKAYGLPTGIANAWRAVSSCLEVKGPLQLYDDVLPALECLREKKLLLTSGFRRMQQSKIAALGIERFFESVYIDEVRNGVTRGKLQVLREILDEWGLKACEVLIVGDSAESEIAAGNQLGMPTVQILRDGVRRTPDAKYHIKSLMELPKIIEERGGA